MKILYSVSYTTVPKPAIGHDPEVHLEGYRRKLHA